MSVDGPLPEQGEAQRIGFLAQKCFTSNIPDEWIPKPLDGGDDFGFDYQIQVMENNRATHIFRAQLKGETDPVLSSKRDFYSISLKTRTVRYYMNCNEPILLVMADLSSGKKPKDCPIYYTWIHEELRRLKADELADEQQFLNFRIPSANLLTDETNLSDELERCRRIGKVGDALDVLADRQNPGMTSNARTSLLESIPSNLERRSSSLLMAIVEEPSSAWPVAPQGSLPWYLNEAAEQLRQGSAVEASEHLVAVDTLRKKATQLEQADYMYLMGKLHAFRLEDELAASAYAEAANLSGNLSKHLVAWAETQLRIRFDIDTPHDFSDVIAKLSGTDAASVGMRARLLAASGQYENAVETAKQASGSDGWAAQAIIHTMQSESELALVACAAGLAEPHLSDNSKLLFHILNARSLFSLAVGKLPSASPESVMPPTGPAGTDTNKLREAWQEILAAVRLLRSSGWTSNVELIVDIWVGAALILGKQRDALPLLREAADARPTMPSLQVALETVAFHNSDLALALVANARRPETNPQIIRRIVLLHTAGKHTECVNLFQSKGQSLSPSDYMFDVAITQAILSAERIIRTDLAAEWESRFKAEPELADAQALFEFWRATQKTPLAHDEALGKLELAYVTLGKPFSLGMHLFMELDATNEAQADKMVVLAKDITKERLLPVEAVLHLSQALATIADWNGLLQLSRESIARYDDNERFIAVEALALDKLGQSTDALSSLQKLLAEGSTDQFALSIYINIVIRCGLIEDAIRTVESIVASESKPPKRIEALRLLFQLIQQSDPQNSRAVDVAWQIGQLVKQDDEAQEGLYLTLMTVATLHITLDGADSRVTDFLNRRQAFIGRFPSSKIMRSVQFPENASADELIQIIRDVTGADDEHVKWLEKMERQLQRGELPVPYAWRPRRILGSVSDLPMLWAIGKHSKPHERQFHLTMAFNEWKPVPTAQLIEAIPIIDLTTLLVIRDLGILDLIFRLFPSVAIGQATLNQLSRFIAPMAGSFLREDCLAIQNILKANLNQIIQPWAEVPDERINRIHDLPTEELKALVAQGKLALYSDDAIFHVYCEIPETAPPGFCTLDVLKALEEKGLLSVRDVAEKISKLCTWNVGLTIELKYQVAILPSELGRVRSVSSGIDVMRASAPCMAIYDSIWDPHKSFESLMGHAISILREFTSTNASRVESVAALMGLWFGKAKLHKDSPYPPERLLVLLLLSTVGNEPPISAETSRMLWNVYRHLIEFHHGDRMDENKEREAIVLVGEIAAEIDHNHNFTGDQSLRSRLALGLTPNTSDADAFNTGYNKYTSVLAAGLKSKLHGFAS